MLTDDTVHAVRSALAGAEATVDGDGWDQQPLLIGLFTDQPEGQPLRVHLAEFPLPDRWNVPIPGTCGATVPTVFVLQSIADILADGPRPAEIGRWLHRPGLTFVGMGFCCEAWMTHGYQGYRYGDLNTVPAMAEAEVRILVAVDIDERLYQVRRTRGDTTVEVTVDSDPAPGAWQANIPDAVRRLVAALR